MVSKGRCQNRRLVALTQNHIFLSNVQIVETAAGDPGGDWSDWPLKTNESISFTIILNTSEKTIGDLKPFFSIDVLSQQFCGVYFISLTRVTLL